MSTFREDQSHPFAILNTEIAKLKETLLSRISEFESALEEARRLSAAESEHAERSQEDLRDRAASLQIQLGEKERILEAKNALIIQELEEDFATKVHALNDQLREKREALESREKQAKDLASKIDLLTNLISRLEALVNEVESRAAIEARRAEHGEQARLSLQSAISALKDQLKEKEENFNFTTSLVREIEELKAKVWEAESQLRRERESVHTRESEQRDIQSEKDRLADKVAHLEALLEQAEGRALSEFQHAEQAKQIREGLEADVVTLRDKLKQKEDHLTARDFSIKHLEENLSARVRDLERQLHDKENVLQSRESQLRHIQSEKDLLGQKMAQTEALVKEVENKAASEAQRIEQAELDRESLKFEIRAFQDLLKENEAILQSKDSLIQQLEETLTDRVRDLKHQLHERESLLQSREAELRDIRYEIGHLTGRAAGMEALARQAEGRAAKESERAEQIAQVKERLVGEISSLQAELNEKAKHLQVTDSSAKQLENSFADRVNELEGQLRDKETLLQGRDAQLRDVQSDKDHLALKITQTEVLLNQAQDRASIQSERAEQAERNLKSEVAGLQARLTEKDQSVAVRDSLLRELEANFNEKIRELEGELQARREGLNEREAQLANVCSQLETLGQQMAVMETLAQQAQARSANDSKQAERIEENLRSDIAALQGELSKKEESLSVRDFQIRELQDRLRSKILELEKQLHDKQEISKHRDKELRDAQSETDRIQQQLAGMEGSIKQAEGRLLSEAAHAQQAERIQADLHGEIAAFRAQLSEKEDHLRAKDSATTALEEVLSARIDDLENQLRHTELRLQSYESELTEKQALLEAHERELEKFQDQAATEIEKLNAELHEKKLALASQEKKGWQSQNKWWRPWSART